MIPIMKKQIAIVEDEPALRDNYAAALARHGYLVKTYGNRKTAMQAFHTRLPDLAIIDISLEDEAEGGFDLCRELRAAVGRAAHHLSDRARQRTGCGFGPAARRR